MSIENPQSSSTPSLDQLLEKARQEDEAKRNTSSPEILEPTSEATPANMEDLLKGLQEEIKVDSKEEVRVESTAASSTDIQGLAESETTGPKNEDPVLAELQQKHAELKAKYEEGHKKFGDAWTSTPEFQALGAENSRFHEEFKSKGFTMEGGVIKPIDKEKVEREKQMAELNKAAEKLIATSDIDTGKEAYAVISGNPDLYKRSVEGVLQVTIDREEIALKNEELIITSGEYTNDSIRTPKQKEDYLTYKRGETSRRIEYLKNQIAELNDPNKLADLMRRDREALKDGQGLRQKGKNGGFNVTQENQKIEKPDELIRGLTERVNNVFDYRKKEGAINRALDFHDYPMESTRVLKGVGLAALDAGDVRTAAQALAFSELIDPLSPEQMQEMVGTISKFSPDKKREFVLAMDAEKKKPRREYKKEVEARSEKAIYNR
jgi:hypothetical protein